MTEKSTARPGRNQPCHCDSGRKYKHCCLEKDEAAESAARAKAAEKAAAEASKSDSEPDAETKTQKKTPKPQTHQPWKANTSKGFVQKTRMPRKVGGG